MDTCVHNEPDSQAIQPRNKGKLIGAKPPLRLQSVTLERGGMVEMKWKELAEEFDVAWPKRLSRYSDSRAA
jgi:hypothetical protein